MPRNARPQAPKRQRASERAEPPRDPGDGDRPCARGDYCTSPDTIIKWENGERIVVTVARGPRPFCDDDRADIRDSLTSWPAKYAELAAELGEPAAGRQRRHGKLSAPPLPIRADIDALMRRITDLVMDWNDRVALLPGANIDPVYEPDPAVRYRRGRDIVTRACGQLVPRLTALLGLEPAGMWVTARDGGLEHVTMSGADAGLAILRTDYVVRLVLGEIEPKPEVLDGIRCYQCGHISLARAPLPLKPGDVVYYSRCRRRSCRHQLTEPDYRRHVARLYAAAGGGRIVTPILEDPLPDAALTGCAG